MLTMMRVRVVDVVESGWIFKQKVVPSILIVSNFN